MAQIFKMVRVGYCYQAPNLQQRTGAMMIKAPSIEEATKVAKTELGKNHDWFKITRATVIEGDEAQKSL